MGPSGSPGSGAAARPRSWLVPASEGLCRQLVDTSEPVDVLVGRRRVRTLDPGVPGARVSREPSGELHRLHVAKFALVVGLVAVRTPPGSNSRRDVAGQVEAEGAV